MLIRDATDSDWASIWPFFASIVRAGDTYCYDRDLNADGGRAVWMLPAPGRTFVAVDEHATVVGSAKCHPNQPGNGSHVATASFMVDPAAGTRGVGRALASHVLAWAAAQGYRAMQFNAVVETNIRAVRLWQSVGFEIVGTVPEAFRHPDKGFVGLHVMHRALP